jgi:N-acetylmuramoyl-L-alanine amidase
MKKLLFACLLATVIGCAPGRVPLATVSPEKQHAISHMSAPVPSLAERRICLDPGHDGRYTPGTTARGEDGRVALIEQDLTLAVAYRVKELLEADGAAVCVTRNESGALQTEPYDFNGNGSVRRAEDLAEWTQPRIDWMNQFGAEAVLSIHFNGHPNPAISGTEAYFSDTGLFSESNQALAQSVLDNVTGGIQAAGYSPVNRGLHSDAYKSEYLRYGPYYGLPLGCTGCNRLFTLGNNPMSASPGWWQAGALVEVLFFSNPQDVAFLLRPEAFEVVSQGIASGIRQYLSPQ